MGKYVNKYILIISGTLLSATALYPMDGAKKQDDEPKRAISQEVKAEYHKKRAALDEGINALAIDLHLCALYENDIRLIADVVDLQRSIIKVKDALTKIDQRVDGKK